MRELRAMTHDYWTLPISVEYPDQQTEVALVRAGGGARLLQIQRDALSQALDQLGFRRTPSQWVIQKTALESNTTPASGDPEHLVDWRKVVGKVSVDAGLSSDKLDEEFFIEFVRQGWVKTVPVAKVLWKAVCLHSLHWLVNKGKIVDMLFCQIAPMPLRPNWKSCLLVEDLKGLKKKSRKPKWPETEVQAMVRRAGQNIFNPKFLFYNKTERYIYWSLDVRATSMWYKTVAAREDLKKSRMGGGYYSGVVSNIKACLPIALRIYAAYLREITRPGLEYRRGGRFGIPEPDKSACDPVDPPEISVAPPALDPGTGQEIPGTPFTPVEETAHLLAVRNLQPENQELR